ncbi:hypothetical protein [Rhodopirellula sp. MGV]|uniref:hypothetical protein n=1 Tax=Rhodopirellula sp. MGV TaxID=2023130 RepID=UPI000B978E5B|nr:hypothetical protein [Rhodopirellula sp. MGV]OYP31025.1 hypothetical protein CGZ80_21870 [Rhodopirellula sp. MGV]PNY34627.1 hypothetical protein C2E31_21835 [Rhodopirellula baltica]
MASFANLRTVIAFACFWSIGELLCSSSALAVDAKLLGQSALSASPTKTPAEDAGRASRIDKELEQNVLEMVDRHLPDVKKLLDQLRKKAPKQYDVAIRGLARSAKRLQAAEKRGEESFELELQIVQAQSSLNLLIAKLKIRDSQSDRKLLAKVTEQLAKAELAKMRHEVALLNTRVARMQQQIAETESKIEKRESDFAINVEKNLEANLRKAGRSQPKR